MNMPPGVPPPNFPARGVPPASNFLLQLVSRHAYQGCHRCHQTSCLRECLLASQEFLLSHKTFPIQLTKKSWTKINRYQALQSKRPLMMHPTATMGVQLNVY